MNSLSRRSFHSLRVSRCAVLALLLLVGHEARAGKSILDYYVSLPQGYFVCDEERTVDEAAKKKAIVVKDVKNGYIRAQPSELLRLEAALFIDRAHKRDIIAVNVRCGAGCMCNQLVFMVPAADGTFTPVSDEVMPKQSDIDAVTAAFDTFDFVLPQVGTTIVLELPDTKKKIGELVWKDGKFTVRKVNP